MFYVYRKGWTAGVPVAEKEEVKRSVAATVAGLAAATLVVNSLAGFLKDINGPNNVKDVRLLTYSRKHWRLCMYCLYEE